MLMRLQCLVWTWPVILCALMMLDVGHLVLEQVGNGKSCILSSCILVLYVHWLLGGWGHTRKDRKPDMLHRANWPTLRKGWQRLSSGAVLPLADLWSTVVSWSHGPLCATVQRSHDHCQESLLCQTDIICNDMWFGALTTRGYEHCNEGHQASLTALIELRR